MIEPDKGLGGRLATRLGGRGNELILTVFLILLPALLIPCVLLGTGRAVVGAGDGGGPGYALDEGARRPLLGEPGETL